MGMLNRPSLLDKRVLGIGGRTFREIEDVEISLRYFRRDGEIFRLGNVVVNWSGNNFQKEEGGYGTDIQVRGKKRQVEQAAYATYNKRLKKPLVRFFKKPAGKQALEFIRKGPRLHRVDVPAWD